MQNKEETTQSGLILSLATLFITILALLGNYILLYEKAYTFVDLRYSILDRIKIRSNDPQYAVGFKLTNWGLQPATEINVQLQGIPPNLLTEPTIEMEDFECTKFDLTPSFITVECPRLSPSRTMRIAFTYAHGQTPSLHPVINSAEGDKGRAVTDPNPRRSLQILYWTITIFCGFMALGVLIVLFMLFFDLLKKRFSRPSTPSTPPKPQSFPQYESTSLNPRIKG